jgi:putative oxidoreductase
MSKANGTSNAKTVAIWVLTGVLAMAFLAAGGTKVVGMAPHPANFARWGFPAFVMYAVGAYEVVGAILLLAPRFATAGALLLIANMVGAVMTRVHSSELREAVPPIVLMVLLSVVAYARREGLQSIIGRTRSAAALGNRRG